MDISVSCPDGGRHAIDYYQQSPLRVFLPRTHRKNSSDIVLANTAGGLVAGDRLSVNVTTRRNVHLSVGSQAAEKVYRSNGADTSVSVKLEIGTNAALNWLPHETILFDDSRLRRSMSVHVQDGGRALVGEMLVFGRVARGERLTRGLLHDEWRVHCSGRLVWADNLHLTGDIQARMASPAGFDGAVAAATLVYAARDVAERINMAKQLTASGECRAGATLMGSVIVARWIGRDASAVRNSYGEFVRQFECEN